MSFLLSDMNRSRFLSCWSLNSRGLVLPVWKDLLARWTATSPRDIFKVKTNIFKTNFENHYSGKNRHYTYILHLWGQAFHNWIHCKNLANFHPHAVKLQLYSTCLDITLHACGVEFPLTLTQHTFMCCLKQLPASFKHVTARYYHLVTQLKGAAAAGEASFSSVANRKWLLRSIKH